MMRENNEAYGTQMVCPCAGKCGGCIYQGSSYEEQLRAKYRQVNKLLSPFGKVEQILGMNDPYHYRCKVHRVIARDRRGKIISGMYRAETHQVVPVKHCLIEDEKSQEIIGTVVSLLPSFRISAYNEDTGYGLLRHVLVRRGLHTGEFMLILVASSPVFPSKNNFVKAVRKIHPEITTIILNVNSRDTTMVLGDRNIVLYGPGFIYDTLLGLRFRLSPGSFYQVNPAQTENLYREAIKAASLSGREQVLDAYCGTGTIGLLSASKAASVTGVELNGDAVKDAVLNAKANRIANARFIKGDAGDFMVSLAGQKKSMDVVFMDPPRSGSSNIFLQSLTKLSPRKIVYVSCNPETLARDLKYLAANGWQPGYIRPVDMFPWCDHIECCVLLERVSNRKADSYVKLNVKMEDYYRIKDSEKEQAQTKHYV